MSKFHLLCSCVNCKLQLTSQNLFWHYPKCIKPAHYTNNCEYCQTPTNNKRFCSHSCKQTVLNKTRPRKIKSTKICKNEEKWNKGLFSPYSRDAIRRRLSKDKGYSCEICGISEWQKKPITLQVDHIDGDPTNNLPMNLRLLCPNCHAQTPTWGAKNKGSGRKSKGLKSW